MTRDQFHSLLQHVYFDNIDKGDAAAAAEAFVEDTRWVHTQVWEHDGHTRRHSDELNGRDAVRDFLAKRITEMQVVGITHRVHDVILDGNTGAFRASVVGSDGSKSKPFFGWVELEGGRIATYIIAPEL